MNPHLITALSSKVAIGVGAAALAFGSAGAVLATQNIGSSSDAAETTDTTDTTVPVVDETTDTTADDTTTKRSDDDATDDTESDDAAEPTFSDQVRALAQDEDREGGIGKDVSKLAHERNAARDHAEDDTDDDEADDTDESDDDADESDDDTDDTEVEDHSGERGRSAEHRPGSDD
jgi:hypothetical protein